MKHRIPYISFLLLTASCSEDIGGNLSPENGEAVEISSVSARIGTVSTRASATGTYIGRDEFTAGDKMTLTDIRRSSQPIDAFNYKDITFNCGSSGAWERDLDTGSTLAKPEEHPERIYWSDAHSEHTFIGYSLPQQSEGEEFDWKAYTDTGTKATVYYGSLGNSAVTAATQEGGRTVGIYRLHNRQRCPEEGGCRVCVSHRHDFNVRRLRGPRHFPPRSGKRDGGGEHKRFHRLAG